MALNRREVIAIGTVLLAAGASTGAHSQSAIQNFAGMLAEIEADPLYAADTARFRESEFRQEGPTLEQIRGNANLPRRWTSDKTISERAVSLIIAFEVTSKDTYIRQYAHPTWPRGSSGVTVGIGYDLGYASKNDIEEDWMQFVGQSVTEKMQSVEGITGNAAAGASARIQDVEINWDAASRNFSTVLRFYAGETIRYFPNSDQLSADSFGALVSLVYNRGSGTEAIPGDTMDRRKEMRAIKQLCLQRQFGGIPDQIRSMQRLWQNDPNAKGLIKRRQLEATLFQAGLS